MTALVVTLPPGLERLDAERFAARAEEAGASFLELRTDLSGPGAELVGLLPLLVAERRVRLPEEWLARAAIVDRELPASGPVGRGRPLVSHHSPTPLSPDQAVALWISAALPEKALLKHVEPLGDPSTGTRLLETQRRLGEHFGRERVTVLATGGLALPFRALLGVNNALEYVAVGSSWAAAPGQRLLADAERELAAHLAKDVRLTRRLGILGARISGSRSPRIHRQPFDRIDLPEDADLAALLAALHPHYRGFSVTSPFKRAAAKAVGASLDAVNTLVRTRTGWRAGNTDVDGARATIEALGSKQLQVLGDGGATTALREAARALGIALEVRRRAELEAPVRGACVWTWPAHLEVPATLRFEDARVAVIAYGAPASKIAAEISSRGGDPVRLGPRWFIAQARAQRRLWEDAT